MFVLVCMCVGILAFFTTILPHLYIGLGWHYLLSFVTVSLLITNFTLAVVLLLLYLLTPKYVIDLLIHHIAGYVKSLHPDTFRHIESNLRDTFKLHVMHPIPEKSIRIWHPHGITAVSTGIHNVFKISGFEKTTTKTVIHHLFHMFPVVSDVLRYLNCISSDYNVIKEALSTHSVTLELGGVDEMRRIRNKCLELVIRKRKGIFKIALQTGSPIVPVLTYGENELFPETDNEFLLMLNEQLYSMFKIQLLFPSFSSVVNWIKIAKRPLDTIHTYTGKPIYTKKVEEPTMKHIVALRNIYIRRIEELFNETNSGDFSLRIV